MDQQELTKSFVANLTGLSEHLDKLNTLLLDEEAALTDQDLERSESIASNKEQLTTKVEQAEQLRQSLCQQLQITPDKAGIQTWLKSKPTSLQQQIASLWKRITYLGQKCSSQNQINGILVAHLHRHAQDALSILRGAVVGEDSYSQSGAHENKQNQKIIAKA